MIYLRFIQITGRMLILRVIKLKFCPPILFFLTQITRENSSQRRRHGKPVPYLSSLTLMKAVTCQMRVNAEIALLEFLNLPWCCLNPRVSKTRIAVPPGQRNSTPVSKTALS